METVDLELALQQVMKGRGCPFSEKCLDVQNTILIRSRAHGFRQAPRKAGGHQAEREQREERPLVSEVIKMIHRGRTDAGHESAARCPDSKAR